MGFVEDMRRLREEAEAAGRPDPPTEDELDGDADVMAVFLRKPQAAKGGEGSGHFHHPGRPGRVGGSRPTGRAPEETEARPEPIQAAAPVVQTGPKPGDESRQPSTLEELAAQAAADKLRAAQKIEPTLTELVKRLSEKHGGTPQELEFRLKSQASLTRKILADMVQQDLDAETVANEINDAVRYTTVIDPEHYSQAILDIQEEMKDSGWVQHDNKWKNFWHPGGSYTGYHAVFENSQGMTFEWQFHTPETMKVKQASHAIYEKVRAMPDSSEKQRLLGQMDSLWGQVKQVPDGFRNLAGVPL